MKKILIGCGAVALSACAFAGPHGCGWHGPCHPCHPWHPGPVPHHYYDGWGRGGCNFWPGFVGGVIGGAIASRVVTPAPVVVTQPAVVAQPVVVTQPTVVAQPVVTQTVVAQPVTTVQNVWVEGRYLDTVQANGTVVRTWQPGHYEQRSVLVR